MKLLLSVSAVMRLIALTSRNGIKKINVLSDSTTHNNVLYVQQQQRQHASFTTHTHTYTQQSPIHTLALTGTYFNLNDTRAAYKWGSHMPLRVYVWMYRIFSYTQAVRVGLLVRTIYTTEYNSYVHVCMYVYYNLCCCFNCFCCSLICCTVFMFVYIYPKSHFSSAHLFSDHSSIHLLSTPLIFHVSDSVHLFEYN